MSKKKKNKKVDLFSKFMLIIYILISLITIGIIITLNILPIKYILIGLSIYAIITLIFGILLINKNKQARKNMQNQTHVTRRAPAATFVRNRNTVRHTKRSLGSISQIVIVSMLTLIFGLIYVAESTKATSFDYEISSVETEITEMSAKLDDLAVEKARLNSVAAAESSTVAAAMEDATVTGYATE